MTAENEGSKRLPVRHTARLAQRSDTAEIVEDERTPEPGPVGKHGDGDREKPAKNKPRPRRKRPKSCRRKIHLWGHPVSRMSGILSAQQISDLAVLLQRWPGQRRRVRPIYRRSR